MVCSHGPMVDAMRENTSMIKKKVKVCSTGLMAESMKVVGKTVNSTQSERTLQQAVRLNKASGRMERDCTG